MLSKWRYGSHHLFRAPNYRLTQYVYTCALSHHSPVSTKFSKDFNTAKTCRLQKQKKRPERHRCIDGGMVQRWLFAVNVEFSPEG